MKKISIIAVLAIVAGAIGCSDVKREPGANYVPDMWGSRAYETYASTANLDSFGINYTKLPVPGTIKRGETLPFPLKQDIAGDSTNYNASKQVPNPLPPLNAVQMKEAERLYLVNCGICHGGNLDGNGPLYNGGNGPYAAAPRNLVSDPVVTGMPDGQMFYSITYGKGQMGPYGPQLSTQQRWMIVHYIRSKQTGGKSGGASTADTTTATGTTEAEGVTGSSTISSQE
jgi:mono/diheme cytochrome c family protein